MDKTITEQIEEIKNEMCDTRCYYAVIWNSEKDGELCESTQCEECPLNRL